MRAGFGKAELTPPLGVELAGYGYYLQRRPQPSPIHYTPGHCCWSRESSARCWSPARCWG